MLHQGGFERVCVATARLLEQYYKVTILIFSDKDINYDITGLDVVNIDVPVTKKFGRLGKALNVFKRVSKVRRFKKKNDIDIAYSFGTSANLVNVLSKGGNKTKVVTGIRCSTDMETPKFVSMFCKKSDSVLSCSREILRELEKDYDCKESRYIYNPLETKSIRQSALLKDDLLSVKDQFGNGALTDVGNEKDSKEKPFTIVTVGRQDYIKGYWHLIKAFSIVHESFPDSRLVIVGTGDFSSFRKLSEDLGIAEKVFFTGVLKNPFPVVEDSDLYVLSSNHEGFPNALLEGMALSKPCVAADCKTGPREILLNDKEYKALSEKIPDGSSTSEIIEGEFGILVPDMDCNEDLDSKNITDDDRMLAKGILMMMSDKEKMELYGKKASVRAFVYDPSRYALDLKKILDDILEK